MNQLSRTGIIAWFAGNSVASNLLLISIILLGLLSIDNLRKEAFPPGPSIQSLSLLLTTAVMPARPKKALR
ncbi:hypothetical protein [Aliamphritea spongicola]|nr:hypothetical protein [Aliamphritea spongicola]